VAAGDAENDEATSIVETSRYSTIRIARRDVGASMGKRVAGNRKVFRKRAIDP
jgi:hypothetical protein